MVFAPTDEAVVSPEKASEAVTPAALADTLGNLSYNGILPNQPVTLTNGYARYDDGSSAQPFVRLIDHLIARGDLNGDGVEDAVVLLEDDTSGTGRFVYAAAVLDALGNPTPTEAVLIGDRIQVKSLAIEGSEVVADLVAQGPGDAACCASWNVRKVFALEDGRLTERSSEELSRISLADLNGTKWRLVDLNGDQEPVLPDAEITMLLADGQISGSAGCNDYNGTVSSEADSPSSFVVGAIATTKKLCSEPVMNQEQAYLARLGKAVAWWFDGGRLALTYESPEGGFGNLVFDPAGSQFAAVPFDLGEAVVAQDWVANEKFRNLPVRLNGLIAAPPTGENLPIAIIIHGSHGTGCSAPDGVNERWPCPDRELRHYEGFAYLLEALAQRGYVAVSINANPAYVMAYGGSSPNRRLPILFDLYMAKIAAAVNGEDVGLGVDLAGRVDLNQLVALGHSAGGEGLTQVIDGRAGRTTPEQVSAGQGPIAAAILLAPSRSAIPGIETALPFAVILPACDRDVADLGGQGYYEEARMKPERAALTASVYLPGANHNRFNAALGDESLGRASAICDGALLPAAAQRAFLADYALHFYDAALGRGDAPAAPAGLDPTQPAPATLFDRAVLTSLAMPTSQRLRLPLREDAATGAAAAVFCKAGYGEPGELAEACRRVQFNQPGNPEQLALTWDGTDGAYEVALPEGNRDLSDYATLHLRAAVDPLSPLNEPGQPQSFSLRLTDGAGKTAAVALTGEPALAFPAGVKGGVNSFNLDTWDNHVILSSIRVPLAGFAGVDLGDMRSVALVFDATERGAIFMTDLELLRTDMTHTEQPKSDTSKPEYVTDLEAAYGAPSQAAFGSAVFHEQLKATDSLEQAALAKYKYFVGDQWERFGEAAWMGPWKAVYTRPADGKRDIIAELRGITDRDARQSVEMILDNVDAPEKARAALAAAFDDPAVTELRVFNLGDGGAMSGILVAGRRGATGEATFLVFLLD